VGTKTRSPLEEAGDFLKKTAIYSATGYTRAPRRVRRVAPIGAAANVPQVARGLPSRAAQNIGIATAQHPGKVISRTAKGLGDIGVGMVAAPVEIAAETATGIAHGDPLRGVKKFGAQAAKDYSRRYGPLLKDTPQGDRQFRERIVKEGAAPELVDAGAIAAPAGGALGRGLGTLARGGKVRRSRAEICQRPPTAAPCRRWCGTTRNPPPGARAQHLPGRRPAS
jgi:hypothetical protein